MATKTKKKLGPPFKPEELVCVPVCLRLPQWLVIWMKTQDQNKRVLIEEALTEKHGLEAPVPKARTK